MVASTATRSVSPAAQRPSEGHVRAFRLSQDRSLSRRQQHLRSAAVCVAGPAGTVAAADHRLMMTAEAPAPRLHPPSVLKRSAFVRRIRNCHLFHTGSDRRANASFPHSPTGRLLFSQRVRAAPIALCPCRGGTWVHVPRMHMKIHARWLYVLYYSNNCSQQAKMLEKDGKGCVALLTSRVCLCGILCFKPNRHCISAGFPAHCMKLQYISSSLKFIMQRSSIALLGALRNHPFLLDLIQRAVTILTFSARLQEPTT